MMGAARRCSVSSEKAHSVTDPQTAMLDCGDDDMFAHLSRAVAPAPSFDLSQTWNQRTVAPAAAAAGGWMP